jgi:hypothetical protein
MLFLWLSFTLVSSLIEYPEKITTPTHYPLYKPLLDIIKSWNPDNPDIPHSFQETLQHFNYSCPYERAIAAKFRDAELPFKLYDIPNVNEVTKLWGSDSYLSSVLSQDPTIRAEKSKTNHFMFWKGKPYANFKKPTEYVTMGFDHWLELAKKADSEKLPPNVEHFYFHKSERVGSPKSTFVGQDLNIFTPPTENFFVTNLKVNKGIQCRFGMRGIIAETHYDSGKNMIAMLRGRKRYILTPPHTCKHLGIISDVRHPSFRHSVIDWSDIHQAQAHHFDQVDAIDTIVQEGEVLYVPSFWFHYIISLDLSIQCNTRSGIPPSEIGRSDIDACYQLNREKELGRDGGK